MGLQRGERRFTWRQKNKTFGKCLLILQRQWTQSGHWSPGPVPHHISPYSLQTPLVMTLFWEQAFHLNFFRLLGGKKEKKESEVVQSCPTLCDPMDCRLPSSSVHGILQARILEWVAISFSRGSFRPRDQTRVSHIVGRRFTL